ncbi:MAG: hypothetical protein ABR502_04170 [Chitinophagaceae bacterium]
MVKIFMVGILLLGSCFSFGQNSKKGLDSVVWVASHKYEDPSFFKLLFLGRNYREEWSTPVKLPVFDLKKSGLKIIELGGGQQTKSLQLEDKKGREWALRSVDKDVEKALPNFLRNTIAQRVTQDMVSAAHPYAPLTISPLTKTLQIVASVPVFYFIPEDDAFGEYKNIFANTVCMLEEREPTPDNSETETTSKVLEEIKAENDHLVIQRAVLRARLLDMLIADWDRHADQWRWGVYKARGTDYHYAIPRDRDQAYFNSKGLLVKLARKLALPHLVGYRGNLNKLRNLNYKSWSFDAIFLNELSRKDWEAEIKLVQEQLTDSVIKYAMRKLPPEIYPISGVKMENKFINRRNELLPAGIKYYNFLATYAHVNGTNDEEVFRISGDEDKLIVTIYQIKNGKEDRKFYERTFYPKETHHLTLHGLEGNDQFIVEEGAETNIRLKIYGGKGDDKHTINSKVKYKVFD